MHDISAVEEMHDVEYAIKNYFVQNLNNKTILSLHHAHLSRDPLTKEKVDIVRRELYQKYLIDVELDGFKIDRDVGKTIMLGNYTIEDRDLLVGFMIEWS